MTIIITGNLICIEKRIHLCTECDKPLSVALASYMAERRKIIYWNTQFHGVIPDARYRNMPLLNQHVSCNTNIVCKLATQYYDFFSFLFFSFCEINSGLFCLGVILVSYFWIINLYSRLKKRVVVKGKNKNASSQKYKCWL